MRILQVIPTLGSGGAEHFVCELSNELCRLGHAVDVLVLFQVPADNPIWKALDEGIGVYTLNKKKGFQAGVLLQLCRFVKKGAYDVVHGHVGAITYMTAACFLYKKARYMATIHSDAGFEAENRVGKWTRWLMFRRRACIPVTISEESERSFEAFYGFKGVTILNGVSEYVKKKEVALRDNDDQLVFLHPASCQPVKNQALLLSAFNRLLDIGYDAKLVWVGNIETYPLLFEELKPLMKRNVSVLGVVNHVRDYMAASDATCLSSKLEGMPMTIIESFSVGVPVLCTPAGGCINLVNHGVNGLLSMDHSEEAYFRMLESFAQLTKEERKSYSAHALDAFQAYKIGSCAQHYLSLYSNEH